MMQETPLTRGNVNHDARGKFAPGNKLAKGNPHAKRVNRLKTVIMKATTSERMRQVWDKMLERAAAGDVDAARLVLDRVFGKATQALELTSNPTGADGGKPPFDFSEFRAVYLQQIMSLSAKGDTSGDTSDPQNVRKPQQIGTSDVGSTPTTAPLEGVTR